MGSHTNGPIARALDGCIAFEGESSALDDKSAHPKRLDPVYEVTNLTEAIDLVDVDDGCAIDMAAPFSEHSAKAIETRVPVVVAWNAEEHSLPAVVHLSEHAVIRNDNAVVDLEIGRHGVRC